MRPQIQQERHTGHTENILFVDVEYSGFNLIMEAITKIWPGLQEGYDTSFRANTEINHKNLIHFDASHKLKSLDFVIHPRYKQDILF